MDLLAQNGYDLRDLGAKNLILGKNGCGKSRLLKLVEQALRSHENVGAIRYLSPERAGLLQYEAGIEQNLTANSTWLADTRRMNQASQFRQQSAAQFRRLELLTLREIEQTPTLRQDPSQTFDKTVARINTLLDRVYLTRGDPSFVILDRETNGPVTAQDVSSGESELISLGIECLVFARECAAGRLNVLLIDEPDVHLHPDLQARFARFLEDLVDDTDFMLIGATHSTAFLGALRDDDDTRLALMKPRETDLTFVPIGDSHRKVLPVFGAHPLSNVFNQAPVLLVEGEDDERIWQQAVRSSSGTLKVYPAAVEGTGQLPVFEADVARILEAVYDNAIGYSLRDRDLDPGELEDLGPVRRMRLACRAAENLLLSDEVLGRCNIDWVTLQARIEAWLASNASHPHHAAMSNFERQGFDRSGADLKDIRNDLVGLMGSNKPWEVLVGQAIANLPRPLHPLGGASLAGMLGRPTCEAILGAPWPAAGST